MEYRKIRIAIMYWEHENGKRKGLGQELISHGLNRQGIQFYSKQIVPAGTVLLADLYIPGTDTIAPCALQITKVEPLADRDEFQLEASFYKIKEEHLELLDEAIEKLDIYRLLEEARKAGATDVHLTTGRAPMMRKHGKVIPMGTEPIMEDEVAAMMYPLILPHQIKYLEEERELDFAISPDIHARWRVNMHWQRGYLEAALRNIPTQIKSFTELGLPAEPMREFCKQKAGLILIAGATGSGKTTTLAAMIQYLNTTENHIIITIEDPVEYMHQSQKCVVKQRELGSDTHSYANALRRVLRQDPDVIVVGELLDPEVLLSAMRAAETGHLVITTVHAPDTASALQRVVNMFPPEHAGSVCQQLSTSLVGVLYQTLLPSPSRGRVPATELMMCNSAISNMIREGRFSQMSTVLQTSRGMGMYTLKSSLDDLLERGLIDEKTMQGFKKLDFTQ
ncbi:MAG: PilT/PilU family type 4a pilus ATPase [Pirellulaceae bacterium]|nr:PilT/PilU family type 4a pilus ATPase [Pirellulaceae bacterium]